MDGLAGNEVADPAPVDRERGVARRDPGFDVGADAVYPGLPSNPGNALAKKQMKNGYGGVISFGLETDDRTVERFCAALKVVTFAVSLGHDESLIFPQPSYDERIALYPEKFRKGFIRFSVGLEDVEDIIADLDQGLKSVGL